MATTKIYASDKSNFAAVTPRHKLLQLTAYTALEPSGKTTADGRTTHTVTIEEAQVVTIVFYDEHLYSKDDDGKTARPCRTHEEFLRAGWTYEGSQERTEYLTTGDPLQGRVIKSTVLNQDDPQHGTQRNEWKSQIPATLIEGME